MPGLEYTLHLHHSNDVLFQESFDNLPDWLQRVDSYGRGHTQRLLIGNKSDLISERAVTYETAQVYFCL